jgi:CubicO group peptidase (beta-lactamase class C family)
MLSASSKSSHLNDSVESVVQSINDLRMRWRVPGIAIGVSCRGEQEFYCSGFSDIERSLPFSPRTVIPIGSVTKPFVAHAISLMVQKGLLDWDVPITDYVKGLRFSDPEIQAKASLADFLSMRTGLDGYKEWQAGECGDGEELKDFIPRIPRTGVFRESYIYSGLSFAIAAMVLHEVSGRPWTEILETELFYANRMQDHAFSWKEALRTLSTAKGYICEESGCTELVLSPTEQELVRPDCTLCMSARDMLKWTGILLFNEAFKRMTTPHVLTYFPDIPLDFWPESYGLGWGCRNYRGHSMSYHRGSERGFRSLVAILPESEIAIAILSNGDKNLLIHLLLNQFLDALLNHSYIPWEPVFETYRKQIMG